MIIQILTEIWLYPVDCIESYPDLATVKEPYGDNKIIKAKAIVETEYHKSLSVHARFIVTL